MALYSRQEHWFSFKDSCISLLESRPLSLDHKSNPSLFFLHGRFGQAEMWQPLMIEFASQFRCIAVDFPGFGKSFSSRKRPFSFLEHVSLVHELVNKLTLTHEKMILIGHDFGGGVAQLCSLKSPEKISALVLMNSCGLTRSLGKLNLGFRGWRSKSRLRVLLNNAKTMNPSYKAAIVLPWATFYSRKSLMQVFEALEASWPWHYERQVWKAALQSLEQPVLLLWGKHDVINPPEGASELIQKLPEAYFYLHEQAGHWPSLEQPEWVLSKMKEFIFRSAFHRQVNFSQKSLLR